jgi:hypothetical protein
VPRGGCVRRACSGRLLRVSTPAAPQKKTEIDCRVGEFGGPAESHNVTALTCRPRAGIGIGQRYLLIGRDQHLCFTPVFATFHDLDDLESC